MKASLNLADLLEVGQPQIREMQRAADVPGGAAAFARQVRIVEGVVVQTYAAAASLARKAGDLEEVAEIWSGMSAFCQSALQTLSGLKDKHPNCGAPELYDLVLDYKLACDKRHNGVMEEIACQKTEFPKGLFPEMK